MLAMSFASTVRGSRASSPVIKPRPAAPTSGWALLEQRLAGQPVLLEDLTQALEPLDLDLPDALTGQADLQPDILQGAALMPAQTKTSYYTSRCLSVNSDSHWSMLWDRSSS